jgi:tetratricopeptide (TPR) repeat protein
LELAPNYSRVQWALGNALLRQGRVEEAFVEIKKSVAADPVLFANAAAATAWQFFDGDTAAIRRAVGDSPAFDASLASILAERKRFDEAMEVWRSLSAEEKKGPLAETGKMLAGRLMSEGMYRDAAEVLADVKAGPDAPRVGQVMNGGFESAVRPDNPGPFEWQIAPGLQPQIVLSNAQKHGGNNSLLFVFNSGDGKDFRTVSQVVAVEPHQTWELQVFYRADLKTSALFKWEVADAHTGKRLALSDAIPIQSDWAELRVKFIPEETDGVVIRLVREGCGPVCPVSGNLWFDDIAVVAGK